MVVAPLASVRFIFLLGFQKGVPRPGGVSRRAKGFTRHTAKPPRGLGGRGPRQAEDPPPPDPRGQSKHLTATEWGPGSWCSEGSPPASTERWCWDQDSPRRERWPSRELPPARPDRAHVVPCLERPPSPLSSPRPPRDHPFLLRCPSQLAAPLRLGPGGAWFSLPSFSTVPRPFTPVAVSLGTGSVRGTWRGAAPPLPAAP